MKRFIAMSLMMILAMLPAVGYADAAAAGDGVSMNEVVVTMGAALSEKYGITIEHPMTEDGDVGIAINSLEILDQALGTVTPSVVRQVSDYYRGTLGHGLAVEYLQTNGGLDAKNRISVAGFVPAEGRIRLYLPARVGTTIVTGDSPITIVHEFGHALHYALMASHGKDRMRAEWLPLNNGIEYDPSYIAKSPDENIFVSPYAATMYEEDFAEVIGHCFIRNKPGQGFTEQLSVNGRKTALARKIDYVDGLLSASFPGDTEMLANFRKTLSAPATLGYQNIQLSGSYLQFIGYPQPRYVLDGTLNLLGKERARAVWVRAIGGWYVEEPGGKEILVFPGLNWADVPDGFAV